MPKSHYFFLCVVILFPWICLQIATHSGYIMQEIYFLCDDKTYALVSVKLHEVFRRPAIWTWYVSLQLINIRNISNCLMILFLIHQIFLLARDWSKRSTWTNISQLQLGDIAECHPSDIPQFSNLTSTKISLRFKFNLRWERVLWLLQKKEILFCSLTRAREHSKKTSHAALSKLFLNFFSRALQNIWRIINTLDSIFRSQFFVSWNR